MSTQPVEQPVAKGAVPGATTPQPRRRRHNLVRLQAELEIPFDPALIQWRAREIQKESRRQYGFCMPYADSRAYRDRLTLLFTSNGWKDELEVKTQPPKIFVTCKLTLEGLGTKSDIGEDWLKNDTAGTTASAQAFKRACSCFGLGRYLYSFEGQWLEIGEDMRPLKTPDLPSWATPEGWRSGLRPEPLPLKPVARVPGPVPQRGATIPKKGQSIRNVVLQIKGMESEIGRELYRGLLKEVAQVWEPEHIRRIALQHTVLAHMMGAKRGLNRLHTAFSQLTPAVREQIFAACEVSAIEKVRDLETLRQLVAMAERAVSGSAASFTPELSTP